MRNHSAHSMLACGVTIVAAQLLFSSCGGSRHRVRAVTPKIGAKEKGVASWYGVPYHGRRTASGEVYDMEKISAAHKRFAFGTWVLVDNLDNGRRIQVRINDRGPFVRGRIIDLSRGAARQIDMLGSGVAKVRLTVIAPPPSSSPAAPRNQPRAASYAVQVAAYRDAATVERLAATLERGNRRWRVHRHDGWHRVLVGDEADQAGAEALRGQLSADFPGAFVTQTVLE